MPNDKRSQLGWLAIVSGLLGFIGFGLLAAALAAPPPAPGTLRRAEDLFRWQDGGVLLQALTMVPLMLGLHTLRSPQSGAREPLAILALAGQAALIAVLVLRFANITSDLLYMIPQGLIGLWLVLFCTGRTPALGKVAKTIGAIAGFGLIVVGVGALTYGALVAPKMFIGPLTDAEIDAQSWTAPNIAAHICMAIGTLLGRAIYPIWLLLVGRRLLSTTGS